MKELKYQVVFREDTGSTISIKDIDPNTRYKYQYYVEGFEKETGNKVHVPLYPVFCKDKRNHFRSYTRNRNIYSIDAKSVNESVIHNRVKELFLNGTISGIVLPKIKINTPFGIKDISNIIYLDIVKVNIEKTYYYSTVRNSFVVFDIEIETKSDDFPTLEIEVVYTHDIDFNKMNIIRALKKDTLKIMIDPKEFSVEDDDLDNKLIDLLSNNNFHWVYNSKAEELETFAFNVKPITHIREPEYSWAGDFIGDVPDECKGYYQNPNTLRKYITMRDCKKCPEYVCHEGSKYLICKKCNYGYTENATAVAMSDIKKLRDELEQEGALIQETEGKNGKSEGILIALQEIDNLLGKSE